MIHNLVPLATRRGCCRLGRCELVDTFTSHGIRTSIFVGTDLENLEWAAKTGTDRVELYTEPYAANYAKDRSMRSPSAMP